MYRFINLKFKPWSFVSVSSSETLSTPGLPPSFWRQLKWSLISINRWLASRHWSTSSCCAYRTSWSQRSTWSGSYWRSWECWTPCLPPPLLVRRCRTPTWEDLMGWLRERRAVRDPSFRSPEIKWEEELILDWIRMIFIKSRLKASESFSAYKQHQTNIF